MFFKDSCSNACLTVLRAPFGGEVGAFLATFFADCVALLAACLVADLALPASLFAAPFITVREPLLACVRNISMMEHRLHLGDVAVGPASVYRCRKSDLIKHACVCTFSSKLGLPTALPRKLFCSNMLACGGIGGSFGASRSGSNNQRHERSYLLRDLDLND